MIKKHIFPFVLMSILFTTSAFAQNLSNKVVAHRGAWKPDGLPENSIASLNRAIELGCGGAEFDVWLTKDDVVVVNHDPTFQGIDIEKSTYEEIIQKKHTNGEVLPTLEEYLQVIKKQKKTKLVLEIKTSRISKERTLQLTEACVKAVKKLKAKKLVDYICFDYDAGLKVLELDKKANVSFLSSKQDAFPPSRLKEDGYTGFDYHFNVVKKHPEYISQARELGLTSNVWTVNSEEDMKLFLGLDVDYITTDEPKKLIEILEE